MSKTKALDSFVARQFQQTGLDTLYLYYRKKKWREAKACIRTFLGKGVPKSVARWHLRRMRHAFIAYGWGFDEYFMFNFNQLSCAGRKEFVPNMQKDNFCDKVNSESVVDLFTDTWLAYKRFAKYYKRDACMMQSWERDHEEAERFIEKHDAMIIKPTDWSFGDGIKIIHNATVDDIKALLQKYSVGFVMEELIHQGDEMAALHPQSVNTIRLLTVRSLKDGQIHVMPSILRVGTGESIVDNTSQGGLAIGIDIETGFLKKYGFYKPAYGREVEVDGKPTLIFKEEEHPDSHIRLADFQIPYFQEAVQQAKYYHSMLPSLHSVGWDIAIGEDGPIFVEGNDNWEITGPQTCNGGLMREFKEYFYK